MQRFLQIAAAAEAERNPYEGERQRLLALAEEASGKLQAAQERQVALSQEMKVLSELDSGFSRTGVQSFALEGILGDLQVCKIACLYFS